MPRRRLDLEAMRDAMLMVSRELDSTIGGRPFDFLSQPVVPRRSIYGFVNRDIISSLASTFDAANPNSCTAKRPQTNVPQQTLFALNSAFIQDRAAAFARQAQTSVPDSQKSRVVWMYQRAFSRRPSREEVELAVNYIQSVRPAGRQQGGTDPWTRFAHVLLASNEFVFVD
jgi:hypothetical protein